MQLWVWRNFRIEVPDDWEMLQFARDPQAGRCAFADRYQFRLELDWRVVAGPPDFGRMMSGYRARLRELGMQSVQDVACGSWQGVGSEGREGLSTRFGRHFPGESCLLEVVFLWRAGRDESLERAVLDSVAEVPARGGARRWRAFGMDLSASSGLVLERCTVEPACAEAVFADAAGRREERFARRGMVREWLQGTVRDWLRRGAPAEVSVGSTGSREVKGHCVETVDGTRRARGLKGSFGGRARYDGAAWICPRDGRLYSVSRAGGVEGGAGGRMACCADMEMPGAPS